MGFVDLTDEVISRLEKGCERAMTRVALDVEKSYKDNIRSTLNNTGKAGGNLLNSASHVVDKKGMLSVATIGNSRIYSRIHEFGGVITAKREWLTFELPDGSFVRVRSVTIPARPTLRPALMAHKDRPPKLFREELARA